jgi:alpha-glucosidase
MKFFLLLISSLSSLFVKAADSLNVSSPDKSIHLVIKMNQSLSYGVEIGNKRIIGPSLIDMQLEEGIKLSDNLSIQSAKLHSVSEIIEAPVPYQQKNIADVYNELIIQFKKNFSAIFRVYNDGVAYRIVSRFKDSITVKNETALFQFASPANIYAPLIQPRFCN